MKTSAHHYSEPDWSQAPQFGRRDTLLATMHRLHEIHPGPSCIVETGTLRSDGHNHLVGDGWSTIAWGWFADITGGACYTVDLNGDAIDVCCRMTAGYADSIGYVVADSVEFLSKWNVQECGKIDLLYLDSLDYIDYAASEAHSLAETTAALHALADRCLILFDDTSQSPDSPRAYSGKGARAVPFLMDLGFVVDWATGGQVLLSRRESANNQAGRDP